MYTKVKVGRTSGYPILVKQGNTDHEAILLGDCNGDDPQTYLSDVISVDGNVKIRWKVAGYNGTVPASSVALQQLSAAPPVRRSSLKMRTTTSQPSVQEVDSAAHTQDVDHKSSVYNMKPEPARSSDISMKMEEVETDSDNEDDKKPNDVSSGNGKNEDIETDEEEYQKQPEAVTSGNVKSEEYTADTDDEDARKPTSVTSGNVKTEDIETDEDEDARKPAAVTSGNLKTEEIETDSGGEDVMKPIDVPSSNVKTEEAYGYDTDEEDQKKDSELIHDGCLRIPAVACTNDSFFEYLPKLPTRDLLCWALRTETNIRLAKIMEGANANEDANTDTYSKTLNSTCLIDIYPTMSDDDMGGLKSDVAAMGHEEYKFTRKSHPQLSFLDQTDEDFNGLTPIEIEKKKSNKKRQLSSSDEYDYASDSDSDQEEDKDKVFEGRRIVPPTMLHFEIILEAFMGYSLGAGVGTSCYHSPDASLPRAAVMGGAVVAALTAYQDKIVVEAFEKSDIFDQEGKLAEEMIYWGAKIELIKKLHSHFIYEERSRLSNGTHCSLYAKGDVDIFLQSSPLTRVFTENRIDQEQIDMIGSYVGNAGICEGDLERYATKVMGEGVIAAPDKTQFAYAVSKRSVSFILGKEDADAYDSSGFENTVWPRSSQFIMLDPQADLVGGLLDFDLSVVACSYDGISVRVAPRAALSLITGSNFVTPFCFEEQRNKKRVIKYAHRGFKPFLVDPYDNEVRQNVDCDSKIERKQFLPRDVKWYKDNRHNANADIMRIQREKGEKGGSRMLCCHVFGPEELNHLPHALRKDGYRPLGADARQVHRHTGMVYTMRMFEITPDDAINFYKERFGWSADDIAAVKGVDPYLRMSCKKCKNEYNLIRVVMKNYPDLMKQ